MKRGFPGKQPGNPAAEVALKALLTQARTLDLFTPESLARSYAMPVERVVKMLAQARLERLRG